MTLLGTILFVKSFEGGDFLCRVILHAKCTSTQAFLGATARATAKSTGNSFHFLRCEHFSYRLCSIEIHFLHNCKF